MKEIDPRIDALIDGYIDDALTDAQFETLCDWLRQDADHREAFARRLATHSAIAEWCTERSGNSLAGHLDTAEQEAELPTIHLDAQALTKQKYVAAMTYVLRHTFTPKRVVTLATAAALLLGVVLAVVLLTGPEDGDDIADLPGPAVSNAPSIVATLSAEHDAVWDRRPGDDLYAGQRFTLTAGFAEITTVSGAVAILEAPATFELLDNENALRLHTGKLVGIVESEMAKGFMVRTAQLDVTDLGTRFGVANQYEIGTLAEVFDGTIQVDPNDLSDARFESRQLATGDAILIDSQGKLATRQLFESEAFVRLRKYREHKEALAHGITGMTGDIQWSANLPQYIDPSLIVASENAWIQSELVGHQLGTNIFARIHQTGITNEFKKLEAVTIPKATSIESYVITYRSNDTRSLAAISGEIAFKGEILGVIAFSDDWDFFKSAMLQSGQSIFTFSNNMKFLALRGDDLPSGDAITISEDRRTLGFTLSNRQTDGRVHGEILRVITRSPGGENP
jgi:hypothetical protein